MSREAKILIFSIILIFSGYLKYSERDIFSSAISNKSKSSKVNSQSKKSSEKVDGKIQVSKDLFDESFDEYNKRKAKEFADDYMKENKIKVKGDLNDSNQFNLDSPDYTTVPKSGFSPYDRYFGKGVYHSTDNSVVVKASNNTHVVFILIDTYTGKRIRNEFIRKGETFTMTKVPYGTYDYMYFTGRNWSKDVMINNGKIKGGFKDYQDFQKNKTGRDQINFKTGYYGSYRIELVSQIGGNLKTQSTSEQDFFN